MPLPEFHVPATIVYKHDDGTRDVFIKHEELGHGGFAVVYRVTLQSTNKTYAMKVISKKVTNSKGKLTLEKLKSEMRIQKKLNHPNIVHSKVSFSDEFNYYIILEYCPGKSIREYLKKSGNGHLSEPETRKILRDVVRGLVYLHNSDIIHHDLKLENYLIGSDGKVKIADFGLSTVLKNEDEKKFTICGTTNYLSPEIIEKKGHGFEVDIWAVGVSAYIMLTGKSPFDGGKKEYTYENIKNCDYQFPTKIQISPEAKSFIKSILKLDPRKRPTALDLSSHSFLTKVDREPIYLYNPLLASQKVQTSQSNQSAQPSIQAQSIQSLQPSIQTHSYQNGQPSIQNHSYQNGQPSIPPLPSYQKVENLNKYENNLNGSLTPTKVNQPVTTNLVNILTPICLRNNSNFKSSNGSLTTAQNDNEGFLRKFTINKSETPCVSKNNQLNDTKRNFSIPSYFVTKYCFHGDDLGYLLGNGTIGVCFKDHSRIVLDQNEDYVQYYKNYDSNYESINIFHYLQKKQERNSGGQKDKLQSKISLALRFAKSLKKNKALFESMSVEYNSSAPLYHVKYFINRNGSVLFKLNDKNIQVNFDDHKKLIIFWGTKKMCLVRSIREKCCLMDLNDVAVMNSNSDELKKFKNAKEMLSLLAKKI